MKINFSQDTFCLKQEKTNLGNEPEQLLLPGLVWDQGHMNKMSQKLEMHIFTELWKSREKTSLHKSTVTWCEVLSTSLTRASTFFNLEQGEEHF